MKLLNFRIDKYRVLRDVIINFDRENAGEALNLHQGYALDFLAGVNGTGKTTVLEILAKLFTTLQTESYAFPIPIELTYSIKDQAGEERLVKVSNLDSDNEDRPLKTLFHSIDDEGSRSEKMRPEYLPKQVVVYTSGNENAWREELGLHIDVVHDAPIGAYDVDKEDGRYLKELPGHYPAEIPDDEYDLEPEQKILFIYEHRFPLVTLCGLLASIKNQLEDGKENQILQPVLDSIELEDLRSFSLCIRKLQELTSVSQWDIIKQLENIADQTIQSGADRLLLFNIEQQLTKYQEDKLTSIFGIYETPIELFKNLNLLYEHRPFYDHPLQEVNVFLRKRNGKAKQKDNNEAAVQSPSTMLHLLDWLSDGERSFLGRMALFALFRADNLLIILDEPEVHFNDVWKREIVHMLDKIMEGCASHAIISTHSSIALTDVKQDDILVFRRTGQFVEGDEAVKQPGIRTLGADPSDIMVHVFGTKFASGAHSVSYIRDQIRDAASREDLEKLQDLIAPGYWHYRVQLEMEQFGEQKLQ